MRQLPPLAAVRVFEAAARHQNFTAAAGELGMTQAAVSYQVKLLEERLGGALFRRERGRVTLTDLGRQIAPMVAAAFDTLDDAFGIARRSNDSVLTVSCSMTFGPNWLAPRIGAFQMTIPDVAVRIHTSNSIIDFARDDVDIAIRGGSGVWPGLAAHFLMRMPIGAYASPAYLAGRPPIATPDELMRLNRISPEDSWWTIWRETVGGTLPDTPHPSAIRLDSQLMEGQAALAGHGVAVLNPVLWRADLDAGRLLPVLDRLAFDTTDFWLVYPEGRRGARKIRAFRDWVLAEVAREAIKDLNHIYRPADQIPA